MRRPALFVALCAASLLPAQIKKTVVASGLSAPVFLTTPPGDHRLFIALRDGRIVILKDGEVLGTPFLDIRSRVTSGGERGLLGLAFHPDYAVNGAFFVNYTQSGTGATMVERFVVSSDPDVADAGSGTTVIGPIAQPFGNHNGGCIQFGPDGYLYIATGDGGSGGDPSCRAQNPGDLLGKMLRLDVDGPVPQIPPGNPFAGEPSARDEIWSIGLRHPWRFSFDRRNGDLYVGDVGQNSREEVHYRPGDSTGGENYGWKIMEGEQCFSTGNCQPGHPGCNSPLLEMPIHSYVNGSNCAVVGGYVYRGCAIPGLRGTYLFGDHCSGRIWSFRTVNGQRTEFQERTDELGGAIRNLTSFGEGPCGELYALSLNGNVYRIEPGVPSLASFTTFGEGCPGSVGVPEIAAAPGGLPWLGDTFTIELSGLPPDIANVPWGVLGLSKTEWGPVTLPRDLTSLGFSGCTQYVSVDGYFALQNNGGTATWGIELPSNANFLGVPFYVQGAVFDFFVNARGVILTNAGEGILGAR